MSVKKIAKKSSSEKAAIARRQGAIPCLIVAGIALLVFAFFFFAGIKTI